MANKIGVDGIEKIVPKEKLDISQMPQSSNTTTKPQNLKEIPKDVNISQQNKNNKKDIKDTNKELDNLDKSQNGPTEGLKDTDYSNLNNKGSMLNKAGSSIENALPNKLKNSKYYQKAKNRANKLKNNAEKAQKIQKTFQKIQKVAQAIGQFIARFWIPIVIAIIIIFGLIPLIIAIAMNVGNSPHFYCNLDAPPSVKASKVYQQYCGGNVGGNDSIAEAAVSLAYDLSDMSGSSPHGYVASKCASTVSHSVTGKAGSYPADIASQLYIDVHDAVGIDSYYASCDRGTCTAVRWSGADDDFPQGPCPTIITYLDKHSEKWEKIGSLGADVSWDDLEPGDIMVCSGHIGIFCGEEAVKEKYPNSSNTTYAASLNDYCPQLQGDHWLYGHSGEKYFVYRNIQPESDSRYKDIQF